MLETNLRTATASTTPAIPDRPVDRCPRCHLVQYRTASCRCRRCLTPLVVRVIEPPAPKPPARPDVAAGVRCWRRARGLTQKQLAAASRLPRTYISRIENGRIVPGLLTLERMAQALAVALPVLLIPGNGNGHNGNGQPPAANGNGNGAHGGGGGAPLQRPAASEPDSCLREILRFSGLLTAAQRRDVLVRVRQLASSHLTVAH